MSKAGYASSIFALLFATSAIADPDIYKPPPPWADHRPAMPMSIHYVDTERLCPKRPGMKVIGCSVVLKGTCWILLTRERLPWKVRALLIRHEHARCNGYRD